METSVSVSSPHTTPVPELLNQLGVNAQQGLTEAEAAARHEQFGPNQYEGKAGTSWLKILGEQFTSPVIWLLAGAAGVSYFFGDWLEGTAILIVILINAGLGFLMEWQAIRSVAALRQLDVQYAKVFRDGNLREVPAEQLTVGDIFRGGR